MSASIASGSFPSSRSMARSYGVTMRQASIRRGQLSDECRADVAQRIIDFLQARHRQKTAENVFAESGIPVETVQKMIDRVSMPNAMNFMRLGAAYGPDFFAAAYPSQLGWLDRAVREERRERLDSAIAAMQAERARL